jgi:hypothetical protein
MPVENLRGHARIPKVLGFATILVVVGLTAALVSVSSGGALRSLIGVILGVSLLLTAGVLVARWWRTLPSAEP